MNKRKWILEVYYDPSTEQVRSYHWKDAEGFKPDIDSTRTTVIFRVKTLKDAK